MWQLYLQYYLWLLWPSRFKQPKVLLAEQKVIREARLVSASYTIEFEKYKTIEHFIEYLKNSGYAVQCGPYQPHEDLIEALTWLSQDIMTNKQLDAATLMPYFEANIWSDIRITVGEKVIEEAIVVNTFIEVPWFPGAVKNA